MRASATCGIFVEKGGNSVDTVTERSFKALAGRRVAHVSVLSADFVELTVPESEGWRLVVSATDDEQGKPALSAHWEPGGRESSPRTWCNRSRA